MIEDPYKIWVIENLDRPGKTQTGLAESLGLHPSAINKVVKGKRQLKSHEVAAAAAYFGVEAPTPEIRLLATGLVPVPLVGKTEAGSFREVDEFDQSEQEFISLPPDDRFPGARQLAFDVEGDSMNALKPRPIFPGDRAVGVAYEDVAHEATLRDGMVVVVQRTRDGGHTREWSIKQVEIYEDRTEFHPRSSNSKHKPIVITRDMHADEGTAVEIIMLVRRIVNDLPLS